MLFLKRPSKIIVTLTCAFTLMAGVVFAQDCETYYLHGEITGQSGKGVQGALVELLDVKTKKPITLDRSGKPLPKVESRQDGRYKFDVISMLTYSEAGARRHYILRVTAPGYAAYEEPISVELCGFQWHVRLKKVKRQDGAGQAGKQGSKKSRRPK